MPDRLQDLRVVDPVLTELARGYTNADLVCETLFPFVNVDKEAGKIPQFTKEAFKIYNTERALRAKSNRINPESIGSIPIVLAEHDLEYPIDYREDQEAEGILALEQWATTVVTEGIRLRCEKKCADLAQNPANYPAGNKIVLSGTSQFTDKANSDPIGVIEDAKDAVRLKIGRKPNTAVIGYESWKVMKQHPQFIERIKYSMKGVITVEILKEVLEIENIVIGQGVYSSDAGVFSDLWSDNIILAYVPQTPKERRTAYEPSFAYTPRKKGQPIIDKYTEGNKVRLIRNTDIFEPYIVGAEAGYLIQNTNA